MSAIFRTDAACAKALARKVPLFVNYYGTRELPSRPYGEVWQTPIDDLPAKYRIVIRAPKATPTPCPLQWTHNFALIRQEPTTPKFELERCYNPDCERGGWCKRCRP